MERGIGPGERAALAEAASREKRARTWRRFRAVELLGEGRRPEEVAQALGCSRSSVYAWAKALGERGIEGLREGPHPGKRRSLDEGAERLIEGLLEEGDPRRRGHRATGWTVPMLRSELEGAGYRVSERTVRRTLKRLGWRWKWPKYVLGRPDPDHEAKKGA
jgi:transposase